MTIEITKGRPAPVDISREIIQYTYFTDQFTTETFSFRNFLVDDGQMSCIVDLKSFEATNASLLLLDRILQSLGFALIAYLFKRDGRSFRFLFIKRMRWDFDGPVRPDRPVAFQMTYAMCFLSARKAVCSLDGTVNESKAAFNVTVEIFGSRKSPWDIEEGRSEPAL
ncbi:hypothetical protein [Brucella sp. IR073]|uniref:hypothetical protein n=1 Tax=unclassified Brucella TaxID=2632610 RepID=UPI003B9869FA